MSFVRVSKYRHVFGTLARRENQYEGLKSSKASQDSQLLKVNDKWIAYIRESSGGGAVAVFPIGQTGRQPTATPLISGHTHPVTDLDWNPANSNQLATGCEDCLVRLWNVPAEGLPAEGLSTPVAELHGHQRKIQEVLYNPAVGGVFASSSADNTVKIWDSTSDKATYTLKFADQIQGINWQEDGNLLAVHTHEKKIRVFDARTEKQTLEIASHSNAKPAKAIWDNQKNWLISTGYGRGSDRELLAWDVRNPDKPIINFVFDQSSGVMIPFFDEGSQILFVATKGEASVKYYEITGESPYCFHISTYSEGTPVRGITLLPKVYVDHLHCEIDRFYKLTSKDSIEPISFTVPRRSEMFQDDIYPPTPDVTTPALSGAEWAKGENKTQRLHVFTETGHEYSTAEHIKETVAISGFRTKEQQIAELKALVAQLESAVTLDAAALYTKVTELDGVLKTKEEELAALKK